MTIAACTMKVPAKRNAQVKTIDGQCFTVKADTLAEVQTILELMDVDPNKCNIILDSNNFILNH